jgi:hypothetical protein
MSTGLPQSDNFILSSTIQKHQADYLKRSFTDAFGSMNDVQDPVENEEPRSVIRSALVNQGPHLTNSNSSSTLPQSNYTSRLFSNLDGIHEESFESQPQKGTAPLDNFRTSPPLTPEPSYAIVEKTGERLMLRVSHSIGINKEFSETQTPSVPEHQNCETVSAMSVMNFLPEQVLGNNVSSPVVASISSTVGNPDTDAINTECDKVHSSPNVINISDSDTEEDAEKIKSGYNKKGIRQNSNNPNRPKLTPNINPNLITCSSSATTKPSQKLKSEKDSESPRSRTSTIGRTILASLGEEISHPPGMSNPQSRATQQSSINNAASDALDDETNSVSGTNEYIRYRFIFIESYEPRVERTLKLKGRFSTKSMRDLVSELPMADVNYTRLDIHLSGPSLSCTLEIPREDEILFQEAQKDFKNYIVKCIEKNQRSRKSIVFTFKIHAIRGNKGKAKDENTSDRIMDLSY